MKAIKKNGFKRVISIMLFVLFFVSTVFGVSGLGNVVEADTEGKGYVTIDIEKFTLGLGFLKEPIRVPFTEGETVADITDRFIGSDNYQHTGTVEDGLYISSIRDEDSREAVLPQYILDYIEEKGLDLVGRQTEGWLGEFDYTDMAGWMYFVNNETAQVGSSAYEVKDGDTIRWQFTVCDYGGDLGSAFMASEPLVVVANKDEAVKLMATVNENKDQMLSNSKVKTAYESLDKVVQNMESSQEEVDTATKALKDAVEASEKPSTNPETKPLAVSVKDMISSTGSYLCETVPQPEFGNEWVVMGLARSGYKVPDGYFDKYYSKVVDKVKECEGVLSTKKYTEYSRLILALSAIGKDSTDVGGYNLISYLSDFNAVTKQGVNGTVFALIALDTRNYDIPSRTDGKEETTREKLIEKILSLEIVDGEGNKGGWAFYGKTPDPDMTAMAIQSLAPYKSDAKVNEAIERGLTVLSNVQNEKGGYSSWGTENSESIAQVITALSALKIDPKEDQRFIKDGNWLLSAMESFYVEGGGFKHVLNDTVNGMATEQGMYAVTAYERLLENKTPLYDMSDVKDNDGPVYENKVYLEAPKKISSQVGTEFNLNLNIDGWPEGEYKLLEGMLSLPEGVEVTAVKPGNGLSGGLPDYGVKDGVLRVVYTNTKLENLAFTAEEYPATALTISLKVSEELKVGEKLEFAIDSFKLKSSSDPAGDKEYMISGDATSVEIAQNVSVSARQLYEGDGVDLIPENMVAIAASFTNMVGTPSVRFKEVRMKLSKELTTKSGVMTYIALVDKELVVDGINNIEDYDISGKITQYLTFGNVNSDNVINAQDALNTLAAWLRKSDSLPDDDQILTMNTTGDSRIDTYDVLSIIEYFVNGTEFKIIGK